MWWLWTALWTMVATGASQPRTHLAQGPLLGLSLVSLSGRPFSAFLGIPFAAPPTGPLRFKEPVEHQGWRGVLNATEYKKSCASDPDNQEDCLYLNVFTPKQEFGRKMKGRLLEVLVNFPLGGYVINPSASLSRPHYLMDKNIVVVTAYYRVAALGFLSLGDESAWGNAGLKDMVAVLRWIKANIAEFGGDPSAVTVSGSSAGAQAVHLMLMSPLAKGLMKRAISAGGSGLAPRSTCPGVEERSKILGQHLGCLKNTTTETVSCLQKVDASEILTQEENLFRAWRGHPLTAFCPVVEPPHPGAFMTTSPWVAITETFASDVPWLITTNMFEGFSVSLSGFVNSEEAVQELDRGWEVILPHLLEFRGRVSEQNLPAVTWAIRNFYLGDRNLSESLDGLIQLLGDRMISKHLAQSALTSSRAMKSPIYMYYFTFLGANSVSNYFRNNSNVFSGSAAHVDDVTSFVFQKTSANLSSNDRAMVKTMVDIWYNFITTGKPYSKGQYKGWKSIQESYPKLLFLNISSPEDIKVDTSTTLGNVQFWDSLPIDPYINLTGHS